MDYIRLKNFFKFRMKKVSWIILISFLFFLALDLYSTFRVGPLVVHLEYNPVVIYAGWYALFGLNFVFLYLMLWAYSRVPPVGRFAVCCIIIWLSIIRVFVFYNNVKVGNMAIAGEIDIAVAASVPTIEKLNYYYWTMFLYMGVPVIGTLISFILFTVDHRIGWKDE